MTNAEKKPGSRSAAPTDRFINGYVPYLLARASQLISAEFHAELAARHVPVLHWRVLAALHDGPMSVGDLADVVLEKQPTMSRIILRMEAAGLVLRQTGTMDRRSTLVSISAEGRRVVKPLLKLAASHADDLLEPLGAGNAGVLVEVLQKLISLHST